MENFSYPVRLEPLNRPVKRPVQGRMKRKTAPAQPAPKPKPVAPVSAGRNIAPKAVTAKPLKPEAGINETAKAASPKPEVVRPELVQQAAPRPARATRQRKDPGLKEERERNGVSLKEIADHTRIPLRHLEELERGDVENWPAGVYAKSWARDYAKEAGIDPERVIAVVAPVAEVEPTIDEIKQVTEERERATVDESPLAPLVQLSRKVAAVAVVLVLLVLAALYFARGDSRPDQPNPAPVGTTGVTPGQPPSTPQ